MLKLTIASSLHHYTDIFKEYNPDLIGFSLDQGNENHANARLNVAISGSIAE